MDAGRGEVERRHAMPLGAEHGDHLVPAPCSVAEAMDKDEMLAAAAALHFLILSSNICIHWRWPKHVRSITVGKSYIMRMSQSSLGLELTTAWSAPAISSTSVPGLIATIHRCISSVLELSALATTYTFFTDP